MQIKYKLMRMHTMIQLMPLWIRKECKEVNHCMSYDKIRHDDKLATTKKKINNIQDHCTGYLWIIRIVFLLLYFGYITQLEPVGRQQQITMICVEAK